MNELTTRLDTTFTMVSCLTTNIVSSDRWYEENEASRHRTYDKKIFRRFQEQEGGMHVELGDDTTYTKKGLCSISFQMPSSDVLELDSVLHVPILTKSLLSISCMTDLQRLAEFDGQQVTIKDNNHGFGQVLVGGV